MSSSRAPLRILFSMRHLGSFRMYESVIRELVGRGHALHLVIDRKEKLGWQRGLDQLLADYPSVTWTWAVRHRRVQKWFELSRLVRIWLDYLRYFGPLYDAAPILRRRAANLLPPWVVRATDRWPLGTPLGRRILRRVLHAVEKALPRVDEIDEMMRKERPDVMLITPLVYLGSPQIEMVRSAKALGVRTVLCVGSWDHLSSKAVIRDVPHRVFVWNETQRTEAVDLHGVPRDQVVVTGAQCYDTWFGRTPSRPPEVFCRDVGLRPGQPFLLYVCSALFWGSPVEAEFVVRWIESLRQSPHQALRDIGVLVRPHPARHEEWKGIDLARFGNVTLYGSSPIDHDSRNDYFDSLYHCAAVVGLNTSAFLEAGIVGRPVHTILLPEFHDNQEGTLHFQYLMTVGGGLLRAARSFDEHQPQLARSLSEATDNTRFVREFVRPAGLDTPATDVFVEAVEQLGYAPAPVPATTPLASLVVRAVLWPVALVAPFLLSSESEGGPAATPGVRGGGLAQALQARRDRLSREIEKRQRWEEKRRRSAQRQQAAARDERSRTDASQREKLARVRQRENRRAEQVKARAERLAQDERQKKARRALRQREKSRQSWRKWRRALSQRIRSRLGLASARCDS